MNLTCEQEALKRFKLKIQKDKGFIESREVFYYYFAIIDSTRPYYPLCWLCNLPSKPYGLNHGAFSSTFKDLDRLKFALGLLNEALTEYSDEAIRAEIKRRIKSITPKPLRKVVCPTCNQFFETQNKGLKTSRNCPACKEAIYSNKRD
jgi:hypothetical protein